MNSENVKKPRNANGEGSLYFDRNKNIWRCMITYYAPNGERKRKSFSGKTKTECRNKKKKFLQELTLGRVVDNSSVCTCADLLQESADYDFKIGEIQAAAYTRRLDTIKIIKKSNIGDVPIVKLSEPQINDFLISLKSHYSNSVIGKIYSAISKAYKLAIDKRILTYNLLDSPFIKKPKSDKMDRKVMALTVEQQKEFVKALNNKSYKANSIDYKPLFFIMLYTGIRCGEALALTPADIDFEQKVIHVTNTITRGLNYEIKVNDRTKTLQGVRDVPINTFLEKILSDLIDNFKGRNDDLLFYNHSMNRPVSTQQANDAFKRLCKSAGIEISGGIHLLRHTFATRCIEAEIPAEVLKKLCGHKDISVTINTYCDVFDRMQNKAIDKFSRYCTEILSA